MNAPKSPSKHRVRWCLALTLLLIVTAGCGAQLPTAPALLSSEPSVANQRTAGSAALVLQDDQPGGALPDPIVVSGDGGGISVGGGQVPPGNHGHQKHPKKSK